MSEEKIKALEKKQLQEAIKQFEEARVKDLAEGKLDELARKKRLHEIDEQEKQIKEQIKQEFERLTAMVNEARDYAEAFNMTLEQALLMLTWREVKFLHFDLDNTLPNTIREIVKDALKGSAKKQ